MLNTVHCQNNFDNLAARTPFLQSQKQPTVPGAIKEPVMAYRNKIALVYLLGFALDLLKMFAAAIA